VPEHLAQADRGRSTAVTGGAVSGGVDRPEQPADLVVQPIERGLGLGVEAAKRRDLDAEPREDRLLGR